MVEIPPAIIREAMPRPIRMCRQINIVSGTTYVKSYLDKGRAKLRGYKRHRWYKKRDLHTGIEKILHFLILSVAVHCTFFFFVKTTIFLGKYVRVGSGGAPRCH